LFFQDTIARYARRLACPTRIRWKIQSFTTEHLLSAAAAAAKNRQGDVVTAVKNELGSILTLLPNAIKRLASLTNTSEAREEEEFEKTFF